MARLLAQALAPESAHYFDTLTWRADAAAVRARAESRRVNLRYLAADRVAATVDETTRLGDIADVRRAAVTAATKLGADLRS